MALLLYHHPIQYYLIGNVILMCQSDPDYKSEKSHHPVDLLFSTGLLVYHIVSQLLIPNIPVYTLCSLLSYFSCLNIENQLIEQCDVQVNSSFIFVMITSFAFIPSEIAISIPQGCVWLTPSVHSHTISDHQNWF